MVEEKEIKIDGEDFDNAINKINNLINDLCDEYKIIIAQNQKLAMAWTGDSGDAFLKASCSLERQYAQMIANLKLKKEDLEKAKEEFLSHGNYANHVISFAANSVESAIKKVIRKY